MIKRSVIEHHALNLIVDAVANAVLFEGCDSYLDECSHTMEYISGICDLVSQIDKEFSKEKRNG